MKTKLNILLASLAIIGSVFSTSLLTTSLANPVSAKSTSELIGEGSGKVNPGKKAPKLSSFIRNTLQTAVQLIGVGAVIMLIYGGYKYVSSVGDSNKVGEAKNIIRNAIIGLIIVLLSFAIIEVVKNTMGI